MSAPSPTDPIEAGLQAWMSGDLDALEAVLDPRVSLRWVEPGRGTAKAATRSCGCCASGKPSRVTDRLIRCTSAGAVRMALLA